MLKIRFEPAEDDLHIFRPDGKKFLSPVESERLHKKEIRKERLETEAERRKALLAEQKTEAEYNRAERLAAKLRELGIEAD